MSTLDDLRAELIAYGANQPRSLQIESGASQAFGCRAESAFRLTGFPESDPHVSWEALVGSAIHRTLEEAGGAAGNTVETKYTYRGVTATIDRYSKDDRTLVDYKTKGSAGDIARIARQGPPKRVRAQLNIGGAALIEAGLTVDTVEALYVPRDGTLDDAYVWSSPFDRAAADEGVEWLLAEAERVASVDRDHVLDLIDAENLRDEPPIFCRTYCPFVTACRGPAPEIPVLDDDTAEAAAEHYAADLLEKEGKARKLRIRGALLGAKGQAGLYVINTSGGREKQEAVEDLDELRAVWKFVHGDDAKIPSRIEVSTTPVRLTVKPVKQ